MFARRKERLHATTNYYLLHLRISSRFVVTTVCIYLVVDSFVLYKPLPHIAPLSACGEASSSTGQKHTSCSRESRLTVCVCVMWDRLCLECASVHGLFVCPIIDWPLVYHSVKCAYSVCSNVIHSRMSVVVQLSSRSEEGGGGSGGINEDVVFLKFLDVGLNLVHLGL